MNEFWRSILVNVVIPEMAGLLRRNPAATDAELIAAAVVVADRISTTGEAWLRSKGVSLD